MQDLSPDEPVDALVPTSQALDGVSDNSRAFAPPGSMPALDVEPSRRNPVFSHVDSRPGDSQRYDYSGDTNAGPGGHVEGTWDPAGTGLSTPGWTDLTP